MRKAMRDRQSRQRAWSIRLETRLPVPCERALRATRAHVRKRAIHPAENQQSIELAAGPFAHELAHNASDTSQALVQFSTILTSTRSRGGKHDRFAIGSGDGRGLRLA